MHLKLMSMKRMNQMAKNMGNDSLFRWKTLVINPGSPLIQNALKLHEKGNDALVKKIAHHEDLAHISSEGPKHLRREAFGGAHQELMQELDESRALKIKNSLIFVLCGPELS